MTINYNRPLIILLLIILAAVLFQVMIGGITRLTGSGLSMTEWKLILGTIPPMNQADWMTAFDKYKSIPQYENVNPFMTLSEFKWIYFWEYLHRMWGRIGFMIILLGFLWFLIRRELSHWWILAFGGLLLLYAAQGLLGWFMVKSGLSELSYVSHYRLTAHLLAAITIFIYVAWMIGKELQKKYPKVSAPGLKSMALALNIGLVLQLALGGFMSGKRAAINYPTWPKMADSWIPENLFLMTPWIKNFGENLATIQFSHRLLGYVLFFLILWFWWRMRSYLKSNTEARTLSISHSLPVLAIVQVLLGIFTLLASSSGEIPVALGSAHQMVALLLVTVLWFVYFQMKKV